MKVYAVIELHEACRYGGAYVDVEIFKNKEKAKQYVEARKCFVDCQIAEKEVR